MLSGGIHINTDFIVFMYVNMYVGGRLLNLPINKIPDCHRKFNPLVLFLNLTECWLAYL